MNKGENTYLIQYVSNFDMILYNYGTLKTDLMLVRVVQHRSSKVKHTYSIYAASFQNEQNVCPLFSTMTN